MILKRVKLSKSKKEQISQELRESIGQEKVTTNPAVLYGYSGTAMVYQKCMPDFVVKVKRVEDVKKIIRIATKYKLPVTPVASGTQEISTYPLFGGIVVDVMGMDKIIETNIEGGYAVIEPGVTMGRLARHLSKRGYRITVGSFPPRLSVIGNYMMTAVNSHRSSGIRDDILGLEAVLPDGELLRTGSRAFAETYPDTGWHSVNNSFPDLRALFIDSFGTLGIITKAAVRIYQINEAQAMPLVGFENYAQALEFMKRTTRANLVQHICTWHWALYTIIDHLQLYGQGAPSEVIVNDPWKTPDDRPYNLVVPTMSGYKEDMSAHKVVFENLAQELNGRIVTEEIKQKFPGAYKFFEDHFIKHLPTNTFMGAYGEGFPVMPIVIADPNKVAGLEEWGLKFLRESLLKVGLSYYSHSMDQSRAIFLRMTPFISAESNKEEIEEAVKTRQKYMEEAYRRYGAVPIRPGYERRGETISKTGNLGKLLKKIKLTIDPHNIMNSGMSVMFYGLGKNK